MQVPGATPGPRRLKAEIGPAVIEAVVQTANTETVYRRAGTGNQVLLLVAESGSETVERTLLNLLAERFRVIAPRLGARAKGGVMPGSGTASLATGTWLRDVIDGLGLERPSIVADESLAVLALGFAMADPDRVDRLVVVRPDDTDLALQEDALEDKLARSGHPLLLLGLEAAPEQALLSASAREALRRFLSGDDAVSERARRT